TLRLQLTCPAGELTADFVADFRQAGAGGERGMGHGSGAAWEAASVADSLETRDGRVAPNSAARICKSDVSRDLYIVRRFGGSRLTSLLHKARRPRHIRIPRPL